MHAGMHVCMYACVYAYGAKRHPCQEFESESEDDVAQLVEAELDALACAYEYLRVIEGEANHPQSTLSIVYD